MMRSDLCRRAPEGMAETRPLWRRRSWPPPNASVACFVQPVSAIIPAMGSTINIRDLSDSVIAGILVAAKSGGFRSREAYLRAYLERSFGGESNATRAISERFHSAVDHVLELGRTYALDPPPTIAAVARALGHADVSGFDAAYRGDIPLAFGDGDRFCELFGVNRDWLESGRGQPFAQRAQHGSPIDLFREIYRNGMQYERLFFVLSSDQRGTASVFGQASNYRFDMLLDNVPIHDEIGSTGERYLIDFALFLAAAETPSAGVFDETQSVSTSGRLLNPEEYRALVAGSVHPAKYLTYHKGSSHWFEDLWDLEFTGSDYPPNYCRAQARYRQCLAARDVTTNAGLLRYLRSKYLEHWRRADVNRSH